MSDSVNDQPTADAAAKPIQSAGEQNGNGTILATAADHEPPIAMPKEEPAASPLPEDSSLSSVVTNGFVSVVGPYLPKSERLPWPAFLRLTAWCMLP